MPASSPSNTDAPLFTTPHGDTMPAQPSATMVFASPCPISNPPKPTSPKVSNPFEESEPPYSRLLVAYPSSDAAFMQAAPPISDVISLSPLCPTNDLVLCSTPAIPPDPDFPSTPPDLNPLSGVTLSGKISSYIESIPMQHQATIRQLFHGMALINLLPELPLLNALTHLSQLSKPIVQAIHSLDQTQWGDMKIIARDVLCSDTLYDMTLQCIQLLENPSTPKTVKHTIRQACHALKAIISLMPADPKLLLLWIDFQSQLTPPTSKKAYPLHHFLTHFAITNANSKELEILNAPIRPHPTDALFAKDGRYWDELPKSLQLEILRWVTSRPIEQMVSLNKRYVSRIKQGNRFQGSTSNHVTSRYFQYLEYAETHKKVALPTNPASIPSLRIFVGDCNEQIGYGQRFYTPQEFGIELAKLKGASSTIVNQLLRVVTACTCQQKACALLYKVINTALLYNPKLTEIIPLLEKLKSYNDGPNYIQKLLHATIPDCYSLDHHVLIDYVKDKPQFWVLGIHFRVFEWLATHIDESKLIVYQAHIPPIMKTLLPISTQLKMKVTSTPPHRLALAMILQEGFVESTNSSDLPLTHQSLYTAIQGNLLSIQSIKNCLQGTVPICDQLPDLTTLEDMNKILNLIDPLRQLHCPERPLLDTSSTVSTSPDCPHPIIKGMIRFQLAAPPPSCFWKQSSPPPIVQHPYDPTQPLYSIDLALTTYQQGDHRPLIHYIATQILTNTWDTADVIVAELTKLKLDTKCQIHLFAALATDVLCLYKSGCAEYTNIRSTLSRAIRLLETVIHNQKLSHRLLDPLMIALNQKNIPATPNYIAISEYEIVYVTICEPTCYAYSSTQTKGYRLDTLRTGYIIPPHPSSLDALQSSDADELFQRSTFVIDGPLYRVGNRVITGEGQSFSAQFLDTIVTIKDGNDQVFLPLNKAAALPYKLDFIYDGRITDSYLVRGRMQQTASTSSFNRFQHTKSVSSHTPRHSKDANAATASQGLNRPEEEPNVFASFLSSIGFQVGPR